MKKNTILILVRTNRSYGGGIRRNGIIKALQKEYNTIIYDPIKEFKYKKKTSVKKSVLHIASSFVNKKPHWAPWLTKNFIKKFHSEIANLIIQNNVDAIICVGPDILPNAYIKFDIPVIVDIDDVYSIKRERNFKSKNVNLFYYYLTKRLSLKQETHVYNKVNQLWVCSELDKDRLNTTTPIKVIPNFNISKPTPKKSFDITSKTILFLGNMSYDPNFEGINTFITSCWKTISTEHPDWNLKIVGSLPENFNLNYFHKYKNIELCGFVDDLENAFKNIDLFICPINIGGGTRIKILDAWSRAIPLISSKIGIEGLDASHQNNALISNSNQEMIQHIRAAIKDKKLREKIGKNGYKHWLKNYQHDQVYKKIHLAVNEILN